MSTLEKNEEGFQRDDSQGELYPCPCCGYLVFTAPPGRKWEICPICFWDDDWVALYYGRVAIGPNRVSLAEGQQNYKEFGASEVRSRPHVRLPLPDEKRDPEWRPINEEDDFEILSDQITPPPHDLTKLYYWRKDYWRRKN